MKTQVDNVAYERHIVAHPDLGEAFRQAAAEVIDCHRYVQSVNVFYDGQIGMWRVEFYSYPPKVPGVFEPVYAEAEKAS